MRNTANVKRIFLVIVLALLSFPQAVSSAPGDLDLTFSQDGKLYDFLRLGGDDVINDTAVQSDGKIIAAGSFSFGNVISCAVTRYNAGGTLDSTFDGDGKVHFPSGLYFVCTGVAVQSDGKIVAVGRIGNISNDSFAVLRLNPDGSLDASFGSAGLVVISFGLFNDEATAVAIQPDGKIVVGGISTSGARDNPAIVRLNTNGTLDTSFDGDGIVTTPIANGLNVRGMTLQPDGKIVLAGFSRFDWAMIRYNADGSIDTSFDSDGLVLVTVGIGGSADDLAIQPDGKIVVAGWGIVVTGTGNPPPQNREIAVIRLNPNGSLDTTFDTDGIAIPTVSVFDDQANAIALQPDGKVVVAALTENNNDVPTIALARFNTNGALDPTLNSNGILIQPLGSSSSANALALQTDGKIVVGGYGKFCCAERENFGLVRVNPNGTLDPGFGSSGMTHHDVGFLQTFGRAVAMRPNGKFVVAGNIKTNADSDFAVISYNADGTPDTSFDGDGKIVTPVLPGDDHARAVAIQTDGKIVVAGTAGLPFDQPQSNDAAIIRYNTDGSFDTTFDSDGKVFIDQGVFDYANAMVIQSDGKIVVAGYVARFGEDIAVMIVRLNSDGSPDSSFDGDGVVIVSNLSLDLANAIAIQPDGKIVVAGTAYNGSNADFAVLRFNTNGSPDTSFDLDGNVVTPILAGNDQANAVAIQTDGKIVAAGFAHNGTNNDFAVVRYNPNGSLDTTFDTDGKTTAAILTGLDEANAVAIQPNGKILVGGTSNLSNGLNIGFEFTLVRYNADGSLDQTYNADGKVAIDFWGSSDDRLYAMALDANGRALVVGSGSENFAVARVVGDFVPNGRTQFDFDGDGRADVAVYRPGTGIWYQLFSSGLPYGSPIFGLAGDLPVPADYDGDGKTDLAIFRPSSGDWWYRASTNGSLPNVHWGAEGDIPLPADIDNDGKDDFVVFRPSNNVWYRYSSTGGFDELEFGLAGDKPVIGDFDGDGRADQAIFRPSAGDWWYSASSAGGQFRAQHWGQNGDIPAPADFDGDGKTDLAVFRPSNGGWYILNSSDLSFTILAFGLNGDRPVPADYDGDGRADIAVFRPSTGTWYLLQTTAGLGGMQWGVASDVVVPNAFIRP